MSDVLARIEAYKRRAMAAGIRTYLVGESLMRQDDVAAATRRLLFGPQPA